MDGQTKVKITIENKSVEIPLFFLSSCLTSHSLALTEWSKKYKQTFLDKVNPSNSKSAHEALNDWIGMEQDVETRRIFLNQIESLFK